MDRFLHFVLQCVFLPMIFATNTTTINEAPINVTNASINFNSTSPPESQISQRTPYFANYTSLNQITQSLTTQSLTTQLNNISYNTFMNSNHDTNVTFSADKLEEDISISDLSMNRSINDYEHSGNTIVNKNTVQSVTNVYATTTTPQEAATHLSTTNDNSNNFRNFTTNIVSSNSDVGNLISGETMTITNTLITENKNVTSRNFQVGTQSLKPNKVNWSLVTAAVTPLNNTRNGTKLDESMVETTTELSSSTTKNIQMSEEPNTILSINKTSTIPYHLRNESTQVLQKDTSETAASMTNITSDFQQTTNPTSYSATLHKSSSTSEYTTFSTPLHSIVYETPYKHLQTTDAQTHSYITDGNTMIMNNEEILPESVYTEQNLNSYNSSTTVNQNISNPQTTLLTPTVLTTKKNVITTVNTHNSSLISPFSTTDSGSISATDSTSYTQILIPEITTTNEEFVTEKTSTETARSIVEETQKSISSGAAISTASDISTTSESNTSSIENVTELSIIAKTSSQVIHSTKTADYSPETVTITNAPIVNETSTRQISVTSYALADNTTSASPTIIPSPSTMNALSGEGLPVTRPFATTSITESSNFSDVDFQTTEVNTSNDMPTERNIFFSITTLESDTIHQNVSKLYTTTETTIIYSDESTGRQINSTYTTVADLTNTIDFNLKNTTDMAEISSVIPNITDVIVNDTIIFNNCNDTKPLYETAFRRDLSDEILLEVITAIFRKPRQNCSDYCIGNKTTLFHNWLVKIVSENWSNMSMNIPEMSDECIAGFFRIIYILPVPAKTEDELIYTFIVKLNETINAGALLPILDSNLDEISSLMNTSKVTFLQGLYKNAPDYFVQNSEILIIAVASVILFVAIILFLIAVYSRRKTRVAVHCITDKDKLERDMQVAVDVGDINSAASILQDEIEDQSGIKNGKIMYSRDDDVWVVPIQMPPEEKNTPEIEDTKM